ncbi:MAG: hypothetical protein WC483_04225 [Candidatus Paceibacterota bacterium]
MTARFEDSLVTAVCKAFYDGSNVAGNGTFEKFILPPSGMDYILKRISSAADGIEEDIAIHKQCELALRDIISSPPDYARFLASLLTATVPSLPQRNGRASVNWFAQNAARAMTTAIEKALRLHEEARTACAKMQATGDMTEKMALRKFMLEKTQAVREVFLSVDIPTYTTLIFLNHIDRTVDPEKTLIGYGGVVPMSVSVPPYLAGSDDKAMPPAKALSVIQEHIPRFFSSSPVRVLFALRTWSLQLAMTGRAAPIVGGAKRKTEEVEKEAIQTGGVEKDAARARIEINNRFGETMETHVEKLATSVEAIARNPSVELITFLADPASRNLLSAFVDINFPSNGYIPILSGYYRTPEVEARRKRYLNSLAAFIEIVEKVLVSTAKELDGASKNAFTQCKSAAREMISSIESANREMEVVFAKLAMGQIALVTAGDTMISGEPITVPSFEAGGYSGEASSHLRKSLEKLRQAAHAAPTKKGLLRGIDQIEEYLAKGPKLCEEAIKGRLDDLTLTYSGLLAQVPIESKGLAKKVIEFKINSIRNFYSLLLDTEKYLTTAHKAFIASPAVRDELYRAIAGWTLTVQRSSTILSDRFKTEVRNVLDSVFEGNATSFFTFDGASRALAARRFGCDMVAGGVGDVPSPAMAAADDVRYEKFRRAILQMMTYCPQLHLMFDLVNIIEKTFGREMETKKLYEGAMHYIVSAAVDVCHRAEALGVYTSEGLAEAGVHFLGGYAAGATIPAAGAPPTIYHPIGAYPGAGAAVVAAPNERTSDFHSDQVGVFFRHALGQKRLEDELFVRWIKSICANLLLALDRDRATHGVEKVNLPGAERLLIGGGLEDPVGVTGSKDVIPEAVPLYRAFPIICRAIEEYLSWESEKVAWAKTDEPRLVAEVPRSSPYYTILEVVRGRKSKEALSETYIAQLVSATNHLWISAAGIADPDKRRESIISNFFDVITNSLLIRMSSEQAEADATKLMQRDQDAISGVGHLEDGVMKMPREGDAHKVIRKRIFDALKGISMSVFDIMSKTSTSEESMAADYKAYVERLTKRIADTPKQDRFRELVNALQKPDETVGDMQGLFMAFSEFVVTPLFLLSSIVENFTYRAANLYMQIARCLMAARHIPDHRVGDVNGTGAMANAPAAAVAANAILARHWATYDGTRAIHGNTAGATHADRLKYILEHMARAGFGATHVAVPSAAHSWNAFAHSGWPTAVAEQAHRLQLATAANAAMAAATARPAGAMISANTGLPAYPAIVGTEKFYLPMYQPIYKALQLLLDACGSRIKITMGYGRNVAGTADEAGSRVAHVDVEKMIGFVEDGLSDVKAALSVFMKIGKREHVEKYFGDIMSWSPKDSMSDVAKTVNLALSAVHCDFYTLREYLPAAVAYDCELGQDPVTAGDGAPTVTDNHRWVVNFSRNNLLRSDIVKAFLAYHEAVQMVIGSPTRWGTIAAAAVQGQPAGAAAAAALPEHTVLTEQDWTSLGKRKGIFAPIVKIDGRIGTGVGLMPWSEDDTTVIEEGWNAAPDQAMVQVGVALNTPALSAVPQAGAAVAHLEAAAPEVLNMGGWVATTASEIGAAGARPEVANASFGTWGPGAYGGIQAVSSGPVIQSLLYARPSYGTKAETFNRLLAKMASCLAIQGEQTAVLYDLANSMVSHHGLSQYFHTTEVNVQAGRKTMSIVCFPEAIGTPIHVEGEWYAIYNGSEMWSIHPRGSAAAAAAAAVAAPPFPIVANAFGANSGGNAQTYKPGTFLYDTVLVPFYSAAVGKMAKRVGDMAPTEMSKYLAAIPQFITAFKMLLNQVKLDEQIFPNGSNVADHPTGRFIGIDCGDVTTFDIEPPGAGAAGAAPGTETTILSTIPGKMRIAIEAIIECLAQCYRTIREKYGVSVHMEMAKGDFDPYMTAGKFDVAKLTTPLSFAIGTTLVDRHGPVTLANFCERGSRHTDAAKALAWATPVEHQELVNMDVVPLESVPWSVALAERLKKMTTASFDTLLQPLITRIARLTCVQNAMSLSALACHNPWGCHSVPSSIFHPHMTELHFASMRAGFDLIRPISLANLAADTAANHYIGEAVIPWMSDAYTVHYISLAERLFAANALDGAVGHTAVGAWATPPFPITFDVAGFDATEALRLCYSATPYTLGSGEAPLTLLPHRIQRAGIQRIGAHTITDPAMLGLHITVRGRDLGNTYFLDFAAARAADPSTADMDGALIAAIKHQLATNPYDSAWLSEKKHPLWSAPAYGPREMYGAMRYETAWMADRTKAKSAIEKRMGFKLDNAKEYDGAFLELVKFSPPKDRWTDELSSDERYYAGLFMYLRRNPISIVSTMRLIPFASIYSFSEAFDLYFQIGASRMAKKGKQGQVNAHIPSLLTDPLSLSRRYVDLSKGKRVGYTWLMADAELWTTASAPYATRAVHSTISTAVPAVLRREDQPADEPTVSYQSLRPHRDCTLIDAFYEEKAKYIPSVGETFGLCAPNNATVIGNHSLVAFPLFAMYIRMLDQYGVRLREELGARLGEIRYDRPESLAQGQNALINILGSPQ